MGSGCEQGRGLNADDPYDGLEARGLGLTEQAELFRGHHVPGAYRFSVAPGAPGAIAGVRLSSVCGKYDRRSQRRYSNLISAVDDNVNVEPIVPPVTKYTKLARGVMRS